MKKIAVLSIIILFGAIFANAQQAPAASTKAPAPNQETSRSTPVDWDSLEIMIFPGFPSYPQNSLVCGVKIGLPVSGGEGEVRGLELAAFSSMTDKVDGVQLAPVFNLSKNMKGAQFGAANIATEKCNGAQFGVVNVSKKGGAQFGVLNFMDDGFLPVFPLINFPR